MPDSSRPRERFLKVGPEGLSDAELFAILLRTGSRGESDWGSEEGERRFLKINANNVYNV